MLYPKPQVTVMMKQIHEKNVEASGKPWKGNGELREAIKALEQYVFISDAVIGLIDFLVQNSPSAIVDIVSLK